MIARLKSGLTVSNLASAAAALALAASPWLAGFTGEAIAAANAVLGGLAILFFTAASLVQLPDWRSWMTLAPGTWVLLSPWILDFTPHVIAAAIHVGVGLVVSILAAIELRNTEIPCLED
jgi:hypothetical protein